jgi:hypothetical protein
MRISDSKLGRECHEAYLRLVRPIAAYKRHAYLVAIPVAVGVVCLQAQPAAASQTCTAGVYHYAGLGTHDQIYAGIERYISVDSANVANTSTDHLINYLDASVTQVGCGSQSQCWLQAGYGIGNVGGHVSTTLSAYAEDNDYYGYDVNWPSFGLTQNDFYTVYFTGETASIGGGNTIGLFDAYAVPAGSGPQLVGQAWLEYYQKVLPQATTEGITGVTETCPSLAEYQYFGTDGSSNNNSSTQLYLYGNNEEWKVWPSGDAHSYSDSVFGYNSLYNYGAFETWKES